MGGLGAGRQLLGVSKPRADALLILEVRAASLGVIYSIPSLFHIKLAPSLLLLLYLFIPFPSNSSEASGSSLWSRNYHMSGTGKRRMQRAAFVPPHASTARLGCAAVPKTLGLGIISSVFSGDLTLSSQMLLNNKGI